MKTMTRLIGVLLFAALLAGCDGWGNKSAKIPDMELREKWRTCKKVEKPSRIMVLACENYERECAKRKKNGNLVCY